MKEKLKIEFTRDQLRAMSQILETFYRANIGQHRIALETCFMQDGTNRVKMPFDWDDSQVVEKATNKLLFGDSNCQYGILQASDTARLAAELQDRIDDWLRVTSRDGLVDPLEKGIFNMSPIPVPRILDDNYDVITVKLTKEIQNQLYKYRNKKNLTQEEYKEIWDIVDKDINICEFYKKAQPTSSRICSCLTAVEFKRAHQK